MTDDLAPHDASNALELAYLRGDFAAVRALARQVSTDGQCSEEARAQARAMCRRVGVDRNAPLALAFGLLLFCAIVLRYVL